MLLIGQFDSPFVRRVGVAMNLYGTAYEHRAHAVFRDAELIAPFNPLRRVPTLVLDDGTVLSETFVCLDVLDEIFLDAHPSQADRLLLSRKGPSRREGLRLSALAAGSCDKAVSLIYERLLRDAPTDAWVDRCRLQVRETMQALEGAASERIASYLLGERISHADIAVTCAVSFIDEVHPGLLGDAACPSLRELAARCESRPEFSSVRQSFDAPMSDSG